MRSIFRIALAARRNTLHLRRMSCLTSGQKLTGVNWDYRIIDVVKGDGTHSSSVFRAEILPRYGTLDALEWALIKVAALEDPVARGNLEREHKTYLLPNIASGACFRKMYDMIYNSSDKCIEYMAFEWLETILVMVHYRSDMHIYVLVGIVLKEALMSCIILENEGLVNTVFPTGSRRSAQPHAMRAPEVWLGQPCVQPSQVWALAAMILCWIRPGILGLWACPMPLINESWCMAKLMRLFPDWAISLVENEVFKSELEVAKALCHEPPPGLEEMSFLEEEMRKTCIPTELKDLLRFMLVPNPGKRPSASYVLASKEFRNFEKLVRA